jgi:hypothetical protein
VSDWTRQDSSTHERRFHTGVRVSGGDVRDSGKRGLVTGLPANRHVSVVTAAKRPEGQSAMRKALVRRTS